MYQIIADGQAWKDADGRDSWPFAEAATLAEMLDGMGYQVELAKV